MVGIIVTGHGNFASGLLSSLKLIAGEQESLIGVDFLEEHSADDLKRNLGKAVEVLGDEVLILTDLIGGSPFMNSVVLKQELSQKNIEVIAGTNLPMLLENALVRTGTAAELLAQAEVSGSKGIGIFKVEEKKYEVIDNGI